MADRVYNLTQTGAEVQDIINDADNAKGAGATTSLTTDYIMLKDTNGQYHKIQKDSFTEAVRNTLASLLVNNDKGTTISQIAAIASDDFGSVTPANLASVLGVGSKSVKIEANSDLNNYKSVGRFFIASSSDFSSISNTPSDLPAGACTFEVLTYESGIIQRLTTNIGDRIYIRRYRYSSSAWGDWYKYEGTIVTSN